MLIQIRTKDDLLKLLNDGISYAWRVNKARISNITAVEIYNFSGTAKIIGNYDSVNTKVLENGRVAIAFKDACIEKCDAKWEGQNPIKYKSQDNMEIELMEDEAEDNNVSPETNKTWDFEPKSSTEEFLTWLRDFQMPTEDFDYNAQYDKIYSNAGEIFGFMEHWEQCFSELLISYAKVPGEFLLKEITESDKENLRVNFDWEGDSSSLLINIGETEFGMQYGGPASNLYINNFLVIEHKRLIFTLFVVSLVKWCKWDLFPDYENQPKQWWGYEL